MIQTDTHSKTRRTRVADHAPAGLDSLPAERRELLTRWVKRGGDSRWETLKGDAGVGRLALAEALLDWLLENGWAAVVEQFRDAHWWPTRVRFREPGALRAALGIVDSAALAERWQAVRAGLPPASPLLGALDALPVKTALARADLAGALDRWRHEARSGTQRDFAYFARGQTKGVGKAEWDWLAANVDLAECGIERHTPLFCPAASCVLHFVDGDWPLACAGDFAALTPTALARIQAVSNPPREWRLLENRTSFEREARAREAQVAVVWLPGYPPGGWLDAMRGLLRQAPAPARIACDPDPAGVEIALAAARCWDDASLAWTPWRMDRATLEALPARQALNDWDRERIARLRTQTLPPALSELLDAFDALGVKGEQEGWPTAAPRALN